MGLKGMHLPKCNFVGFRVKDMWGVSKWYEKGAAQFPILFIIY
jgi:hypothetical protein